MSESDIGAECVRRFAVVDANAVADELYTLAPADFTAARDRAAGQAKQSGDKEAADRLRALRKPTLAAFAVNRLVHTHRAEIDQMLALGRSLREAQTTLSGSALRKLSAQRHQLVTALTAQARATAADTGQHLAEAQLREVEQTLRAALASEDAAGALAGGRLTTTLEESGALPAVPAAGTGSRARTHRVEKASAAPSRTRRQGDRQEEAERARTSAKDKARREEAEARADVEAAEREEQAADRELTRLEKDIERLGGESQEADEHVDRARVALQRAEAQLAEARAAESDRRSERDEAERRAQQARTKLEKSRAHLTEVRAENEKGGR